MALLVEIQRVFTDRNLGRGLAGVRKVWRLLRRDPNVMAQFGQVARCTVERLMRAASQSTRTGPYGHCSVRASRAGGVISVTSCSRRAATRSGGGAASVMK